MFGPDEAHEDTVSALGDLSPALGISQASGSDRGPLGRTCGSFWESPSPSHVAASLLWLLRPPQPHSCPRRRVRAGAAPSRPLGPPQNRGPRAPGTRPGCRRRSARGRDHHWLRPGPGRWGALTLPALGTWASPAFPTPRGCSRHVAWRQPCGVQTTRMVSVTQLSHGLCTNL